MHMTSGAVLDTCFFCANAWGRCTCDFPRCFTDDGEPGEEQPPGFEWKGFWITQPNVSVCTRFFVDPFEYYGDAYVAFEEKHKPRRG